jgi:hypothetical protein
MRDASGTLIRKDGKPDKKQEQSDGVGEQGRGRRERS